jgi:hypothetical protein
MKNIIILLLIYYTLLKSEFTPTTIPKIPTDIRSNKSTSMITREDFMNAFKFHHMTNVELMDIFGMADINKDGFLSIEEWKAFHRIFISEFELCIEGDSYALDVEGLECQLSQDWFKRIA